MPDLKDYPCPMCGWDGPHPVLAREGDDLIVECASGECGEFSAPTSAVEVSA